LKAIQHERFVRTATLQIVRSRRNSNLKETGKMAEKDTSNRGFGSMDDDKQQEIARQGGHTAHEKGTAHEFSPDEAREAGRKGGEAVSSDRAHMSEIGRKGGEHSHGGQSTDQENDRGSGQGDSHAQGKRGGSSEQHAEAGRQSHKNAGQNAGQPDERDRSDAGNAGSQDRGTDDKTRGGSSEQHAEAGRQSHKNR
jgi:uncharacterized protein